MAQPPPHPFTSGINIKLALSAAFSTQPNLRNIEANYTPAWIATLCDACAFSNRLSVATEPYFSIPGEVINELKIKAKGEELLETRQELNAALETEAARNPPAGSSRQSARIPLLSAVKLSDKESALQKEERDWRYENRSVQKQKHQEKKDQEEGKSAFSLHASFCGRWADVHILQSTNWTNFLSTLALWMIQTPRIWDQMCRSLISLEALFAAQRCKTCRNDTHRTSIKTSNWDYFTVSMWLGLESKLSINVGSSLVNSSGPLHAPKPMWSILRPPIPRSPMTQKMCQAPAAGWTTYAFSPDPQCQPT